jgi:cytochrome c oxidase assembly protein subunit 15/protoheme IX farnesyltransferase
VFSGVSIVIEALIGAVIVLAELVADNASVARAVSVPIHLVSTFVLLAGLVLTVFWLSGGGRLRFRGRREQARPLVLIALGLLLIGATGGVTALADTLFPKEAFELEGIFETSTSENLLTQLRALHPAVALLVGLIAATWAAFNAWSAPGGRGRAARTVVGLVGLEFMLGILNVLLLTPVWLSLVHLAVADGLWIAWVWLGAEFLQVRDVSR